VGLLSVFMQFLIRAIFAMRTLSFLAALLLLAGCGRYFPAPLRPTPDQAARMSVNDDGSVTYTQDRLELILQPMTDAQLNRQFAAESAQGAGSTNPYTFGNWEPMGSDYTPQRFTVFLLTVRNYQFPKVLLDPVKARMETANNRQYQAMSYAQLDEYFRAYWQGRTGQGRERFESRTDLLRRTLFPRDLVFSGQETHGYIVFPALHDDVTQIKVSIPDIVVRFDYAGQPMESIDIDFAFAREVFRGNRPPVELAREQ
jgi:predicted small lipoprotein YifL